MATVIQIKRSSAATAPATLKLGELAYTYGTGTQANLGDRLFIGEGGVDGNGDANNVTVIGGQYFTDKLDNVDGTLTASSAITVDSNKAIDELFVGNSTSTGGTIKFNEGTDNGSNFVGLKAPNNVSSSVTFTLPGSDGTNGQALLTDGSGVLSFGDVASNLTIVDDSSTSATISLTNDTLSLLGGTGISSTVSGDTVTFAIDNTVVTTTGTQTLTNKTIDTANNTITIVEADISDLGSYIENITGESIGDLSDVTITSAGSGDFIRYNGTAWVDSTIQNSDISQGAVTQHQAALSITESQISDLQSYLTAETNDLSAAVVWANVPNANITQGSVTQHQAALSIATTQLTGTITNAQLAGSITNAKLVNSSVTIGSDTVSLGGTQTDLNGITSLDVDNITVDANTISTTDTNGDLVLSPNGTATVTVPSGYEGRSGFSSDSLVNKSYVDSVANGLDVKASVRVATTGNLSTTYNNSNGTLTATANAAISIDGVSLSLNDRVLVKDQTNQVENGFYKVTNTGGASAAFVLTRTPDANEASEITGGAFTFVEEGTNNADNGYVATHNGTPTLGTDNITFDQFSGAGQISAGNGLTKTGNTIDAVGTANRISVSANAIDIASTYVGQSSITTLGTIATGTWNADTIGVAYGGTGITSAAKGSVLIANSADTLSALDGGGANDGFLSYSASTDTISWATSIDGGTF